MPGLTLKVFVSGKTVQAVVDEYVVVYDKAPSKRWMQRFLKSYVSDLVNCTNPETIENIAHAIDDFEE